MRSLKPVDRPPVRPARPAPEPAPATPLPRRPSTGLPRRRVLGLGTVVGLLAVGALTGCQDQSPAAEPELEPDEAAVNQAVDAARALRADALATAQTHRSLASLLRRVAAVHEAHLAALGAPVPAATVTTTAASGPTPGSTPKPTTAAAGPTALAKAETTAARAALRDALAATGPFATLLGRIAAARIVNADLINNATARKPTGVLRPAATPTPTAPGSSSTTAPVTTSDPQRTGGTTTTGSGTSTSSPTSSPSTSITTADDAPSPLRNPDSPALTALDRLLAGEHAAVFVYPLIVARAAANRRDLALNLWQQHRNHRDAVTAELQSAGIQPTVSEPAYAVGPPPTSGAKAAALAVRVERGLAALAADLLVAGAAGDPYRAQGADELVVAARRIGNWTGRPEAFPGMVTPAPTPTQNQTAAPSRSPSSSPTSSAPTSPISTGPIPIAPDRPSLGPNLSPSIGR